MTTTMLNLAPLIDGYKWLLDNPEHFNMSVFLGKRQDNKWYKDTGKVFYQSMSYSPIKPECGTVLCICGAALLANAIRRKKEKFELREFGPSAAESFMILLKQTNEHLPKYFDFDWEDVQEQLFALFYGKWYYTNVKADVNSLTLEEAWQGIKLLCKDWGYEPDVAGYEQYEWLKG